MTERTSTRRDSNRQEKQLVVDFGGGRPMPASGALSSAKDDYRFIGLVRVEAKTTKHDKYRFDPRDFIHLRRRAITMGELPVFQVNLSDGLTRLSLTETHLEYGISKTVDVHTRTHLLTVGMVEAGTCVELRFLSMPRRVATLVLYVMHHQDLCRRVREQEQ